MARTNNLTNFLTDVSSAIKQKTGDNTPIPASDFDTEILSIETAGNYQSKTLNVTQNGNYNLLPDQGYDAMSNVNISVNVPTGEDLETEISTQEEYIAQLEAIIDTKSAGSGDGSSMNIFAQETEPDVKKGIWLKTNKTMEHILCEDSIVESETWYLDGTINDIPYEFYYGNTTSVGTDIYLFGSNYNSSTKRYNYKYDTLNNTYTRMANTPADTTDIQCITFGTNIYLFGAGTNFTLAYKYDTLTDTYTQLTNIPYGFRSGGLALINTDIYLIGGNYSTDSSTKHKYIYKYDTLTDTYTYINTIPETYMFYNGGICSIGTNIYMFGNGTYQSPITNQMAYKYDVLTNIFTRLTDVPYSFQYAKSINEGTNIYLFGSGVSNYSQYCYKYDTLTDTYQRLTDISRPFARGSIAKVNQKIYLFGGYVGSDYSYDKKVQCLQLNVIDIDTDNTVVINQGSLYNVGYQTELFSNIKCDKNAKYSLADAWFYTTNDGLITDIPSYYGDGTQWINFKNPPVEEVEE